MLKSQGVFKMISKKSYKLLKKAADSPESCIPQEENPNLAIQLERNGFLEQKLGKGCQSFAYLTDKGLAAIEEYERTLRKEKRDIVTLIVAWIGAVLGVLGLIKDIAEYLCH